MTCPIRHRDFLATACQGWYPLPTECLVDNSRIEKSKGSTGWHSLRVDRNAVKSAPEPTIRSGAGRNYFPRLGERAVDRVDLGLREPDAPAFFPSDFGACQLRGMG